VKVIHTVGPVYWLENERDENRAEKLLRSCYRRSLMLATQHGMKSIAFSCISTGIYGYPSMDAANVAIQEVREFLEQHPDELQRVVFCTFEKKDERAYEMTVPSYFPPTEQVPPASSKDVETAPETETESSSDPPTLAATLPDPPSSEPTVEGERDSKKLKVASGGSKNRVTGKEDERSEDDWEEVDKAEGSAANGPPEKLDDEPVEVDSAPTPADVQSVESSTADLGEGVSVEERLQKD